MLGMLRTIILIALTAVTTVFVVQNLAPTEVAFLVWAIQAPRAVVFALLFIFGLIVGYLAHALRRRPPPPPPLGLEPPAPPPL